MSRFLRSLFSFSVLAIIAAPSSLAGTAPFPDLNTYSSFFNEVYELQLQGIVQGQGDGNLDGDSTLNRAEMVALLIQASGMTDEEVLECSDIENLQYDFFSDVPVNEVEWYTADIYCAFQKGWVTGDDTELLPQSEGSTTFRPGDTVNFAEAMALFVRFYVDELPLDYEGTEWYDTYFMYLTDMDILEEFMVPGYTGYGVDYNFSIFQYIGDESSTITRAQAFSLFYMMQVAEEDGELTHYYPLVTIDELDGLDLEVDGDEFTLTNTEEGFELSHLPLPEGGVDELRFWIDNPSGDTNGYYSMTHILYPYTSSGSTELMQNELCEGSVCYDDLALIASYDNTYVEGQLPFDPQIVEEDKSYQLTCFSSAAVEEDLAELAEMICDESELSSLEDRTTAYEDVLLSTFEKEAELEAALIAVLGTEDIYMPWELIEFPEASGEYYFTATLHGAIETTYLFKFDAKTDEITKFAGINGVSDDLLTGLSEGTPLQFTLAAVDEGGLIFAAMWISDSPGYCAEPLLFEENTYRQFIHISFAELAEGAEGDITFELYELNLPEGLEEDLEDEYNECMNEWIDSSERD